MIHALTTSAVDRLMGSLGRPITRDFARELVALRADSFVQARTDELAEKYNEGTLSAESRVGYEKLVGAIHLSGILQSKARPVLFSGGGLDA